MARKMVPIKKTAKKRVVPKKRVAVDAPQEIEYTTAQEILVQVAGLEAVSTETNAMLLEKRVELLDVLRNDNKKTVSVVLPDGGTATFTRNPGRKAITIDEDMLRKKLGAKTWALVVSTSLDKKKLEGLIQAGVIDATTVAACTTETEGTEYGRFSRK